ncbi:hypothetical protein A1O7_05971 [Cladophialophora yegresii CBS 114405]|uniref:RNA 3'-terminal phosphate cyclase domain-containing protein n=1 Tax=Cladophialophora yegresii CBS 114405 TaxID=1182544 RepID=W9WJ72_9EURO|nr:uncharacterized protein A1O7_05971 [Cladophialophora yegresii CBS 114405]EXJ58544.1 hypothetical protein A1O7_05971 [Cladophialophora yegresii CBS 114405]
MITLDGSTLEGGGQLVRVALSISAICDIPVRITNIRAGRGPGSFYKKTRKRGGGGGRHGDATSQSVRSKKSATGGGLKESHLAALTWLARECGAAVEGAEVNSLEVVFNPKPNPRKRVPVPLPVPVPVPVPVLGPVDGEPEVIELRNPGSIWLIWQAIFPYIVFAVLREDGGTKKPEEPTFRLRLKGGTNVPKSPSSEYMQQVFLPLCERIGLPKVHVNVTRRGWTTGAPEIGEVEISVFEPGARSRGEAAGTTKDAGSPKGSNIPAHSRTNAVDSERPLFRLPPFDITLRDPFTIRSISITTLSGSPQTHALLHTLLRDSLRSIPRFSDPSIPITAHPSCSTHSGDERRLYILLTAHVAGGYILGRDYLGPGKKITDETDRRRIVDEAVNTAVRDFRREVGRGRCVDEFAEDQLVVFQALADGRSIVDTATARGRVSEHANANANADADAHTTVETKASPETETGSLHTRTVRWVCHEMLGTVFDGVGRCQGGGLRVHEGGVDEVSEKMSHWGLGADGT